MIQYFKKKIKLLYRDRISDPELAREYLVELNEQSSRLLFLVGILGTIAWLFYIDLDKKIHPELNLVPFRLGFTLISLLLLVLNKTLKRDFKKKYGILLLSLPLFYVILITPVITGLTKADASYSSGLNIVIMLLPLAPIPLYLSLPLLFASSAILIFFLQGTNFYDVSVQYTLQNIFLSYIISAIFCYSMDIIRSTSFRQGILLKNNLQETESLLLNILPKEVAMELRLYGSALPIKYKSVSVLFTDFVGFTAYARDLSPDELIRDLDQCFTWFDTLSEDHHLEKLKTIGDSYMCAGGVPTPNMTHPVDTILTAMEMRDFIHQMKRIRKSQNHPYWDIRIGINTGPLVAGVVGKIKFAYDVWGDTVNTASRMETYGISDEINISHSTWLIAKDFFKTYHRGKMEVKNIGELNMYLVQGIKKELSIKGEGEKPNEKFWEKYEELKNSSFTE